jgi:predicted membrane protein DUF2339
MPLLTTLVGAMLGVVLGRGFDGAVAGGFIGLIAGLVFDSWRKNRRAGRKASATAATGADDGIDALALLDPRVAERVRALERRIETLERDMQKVGASATAQAVPTAGRVESGLGAPERTEVAEPLMDAHHADVPPAQPAIADGGASIAKPAYGTPAGEAVAGARPPDVPPTPAYAVGSGARPPRERREANALWRFVAGGNTLARVGVVVLFIGVAFLLKYASEHVSVPIELRLAAVALGGVVLLVLGWRLRHRRSGYAMSLQGAAIGVLYLTVFAALRLYQLIPPLAAFALLFWIAALSSFLAVRQDAMALAILGIVGGFAAPVLTSTGAGSHVVLFSYYAVLNAGVFAIAWFKAWRLLNVIGFACTFVIGTLWGVTRYRPEDFATTEPFLILFFLYYVGIATLYAMRRSLEVKRYVDGTLVFATPLFAAGLQAALVRRIEYGMAWSAIGASAVYLLLARSLYQRHRDDLRLLVESYLALGVVFATLAVPLALDARLTSATWALEGAALVWVGARQRHVGPRAFGLALQVAAGVAFALGFSLWTQRLVGPGWPIVNSDFIGALLVSVGGVMSARVLSRAPDLRSTERALIPVVFAWGVLWWVGAGWQEIERFVAFEMRLAAFVAFIAASAVFLAALAHASSWPLARVPALLGFPAMFAVAVFGVANAASVPGHLFGATRARRLHRPGPAFRARCAARCTIGDRCRARGVRVARHADRRARTRVACAFERNRRCVAARAVGTDAHARAVCSRTRYLGQALADGCARARMADRCGNPARRRFAGLGVLRERREHRRRRAVALRAAREPARSHPGARVRLHRALAVSRPRRRGQPPRRLVAGGARCGRRRTASVLGDVRHTADAASLGRRAMVRGRHVECPYRAGGAVDRLVDLCACCDGDRASTSLPRRVDRWRRAAGGRRRKAVLRRSVAGRRG